MYQTVSCCAPATERNAFSLPGNTKSVKRVALAVIVRIIVQEVFFKRTNAWEYYLKNVEVYTGEDMVFFCSGTKEGNWGSPLSSTSVFPVFYVCEQDIEVGNDLVAQCLRHPTYCFEHVVEHSA